MKNLTLILLVALFVTVYTEATFQLFSHSGSWCDYETKLGKVNIQVRQTGMSSSKKHLFNMTLLDSHGEEFDAMCTIEAIHGETDKENEDEAKKEDDSLENEKESEDETIIKETPEKEDQLAEKEDQAEDKEDQLSEKEDQAEDKEDQLEEKEDQLAEKEDKTLEKEDKTLEIEDQTLEKEDKTLEKEDKTLEIEDKTLEIEDKALEIEDQTLEIEDQSVENEDQAEDKEDQAEDKEDQAEEKEDQAEEKEDQAEEKEVQVKEKEDQAEEKEDQAEDKDDKKEEKEDQAEGEKKAEKPNETTKDENKGNNGGGSQVKGKEFYPYSYCLFTPTKRDGDLTFKKDSISTKEDIRIEVTDDFHVIAQKCISEDAPKNSAKINLSFRQIKGFKYENGEISFNFYGITTQAFTKIEIHLFVYLYFDGKLENELKEAICTLNKEVQLKNNKPVQVALECKITKLEKKYTSFKIFESEEIAGIPYDNEVLLDPIKTEEARQELYWTIV